MRRRSRVLSVLSILSTGCGGSGSPVAPTPRVETFSVAAVVFYDENANGILDPLEGKVPEVVVEVSGRRGTAARLTGELTIADLPRGNYTASVIASSLPPFYAPGPLPALAVPQPPGTVLQVPLTLPIGPNRPNTYLAFGDSITSGDGARGAAWPERVQIMLREQLGRGTVVGDGLAGTRSNRGADRLPGSLDRARPAYLLILYGTNDWNSGECKDAPPCYTIDSLRDMVRTARSVQSLPVLGTIPPVNPGQTPPERNLWVTDMNRRIRAMAQEEGAAVADVQAGFLRLSDLPRFFVDHIHLNDEGHQVIAVEFVRAITAPRGTAPVS